MHFASQNGITEQERMNVRLRPGLGLALGEWDGRLSRARGSQSETEPAGCREPEVKAESVNRPRNSQMNWRFIESAVHAAIL